MITAPTILPALDPVFPSDQKTVFPFTFEGDPYNGAHKYQFINCLGFENGHTQYENPLNSGYSQVIQFVHKADDGTITPGLQSEQLVIALLDRVKKMNARFPCEENDLQVKALEDFLAACKLRVTNRIARGVMGNLQK